MTMDARRRPCFFTTRDRREIRDRDKNDVYAAVAKKWIDGVSDPMQLCEAMWIQGSFRDVDPALLSRILSSDDFHAQRRDLKRI